MILIPPIIAAVLCFAGQDCRKPKPPPPPMQTALASYYDYADPAATACGWSAPLGVANRALPCGTRVRFCAARCATAVVDDRGPYIYSRLWDLTVATARAIGFDFAAGVSIVRWRVVR
jgi:rare lipoprotein A (peptidoglycan hydrolase)